MENSLQQTQKKKVTIAGTLFEIGKSGSTRAGKNYYRFSILDKHKKVFCCWAYNERAAAAEEKLVTPGMEVIVYGTYRDEEAEGKGEVWLSSFSTPGAALTGNEQLIKTYGSLAEAKKRHLEARKEKEKIGYVFAQELSEDKIIYRWIAKSDAVEFLPGKFKSKVEHLMDTLGAKKVCESLQPFTKAVTTLQFKTKEYQDVIAALFSEAKLNEAFPGDL